MRHRSTVLALSTIAVLSLGVGCASDPGVDAADGSPTEETSSAVASSPTSSPAAPSTSPVAPEDEAPVADVPPFGDGTGRQSGKGTGSGLVLVDVRLGEGDGYDRLVLEFRGTGTPGWTAAYTDDPVLDGSGEPVDLDGGAALDVYASGTTAPAPGYYSGPERLAPPSADGPLSDVHVGGTFEGYTQVLAGVGDRVPFRVFALTSPSRLVIDVEDDAGS